MNRKGVLGQSSILEASKHLLNLPKYPSLRIRIKRSNISTAIKRMKLHREMNAREMCTNSKAQDNSETSKQELFQNLLSYHNDNFYSCHTINSRHFQQPYEWDTTYPNFQKDIFMRNVFGRKRAWQSRGLTWRHCMCCVLRWLWRIESLNQEDRYLHSKPKVWRHVVLSGRYCILLLESSAAIRVSLPGWKETKSAR